MKKRRRISIVLVMIMLAAGCSNVQSKGGAGTVGNVTGSAAEAQGNVDAQGNVVPQANVDARGNAVSQANVDAQGNATSQTNGDAQGNATTNASDAPEATQAVQLTMQTEPEPFTFNPHVHSDLVSEVVPEETWDSFYNMCDAIRAGEDTFECVSKEAYEWCTDEVTIGSYLPAACTKVAGSGYKDGVGKLKYKMDKEQFLAREQAFEEEICKMLNEATRSDASDFEKLMGIYDYVCKHWVYDYSEIDGASIEEFGNYACLMRRDGICAEIASALTYLLLQCDVEAMPFGTSCEHEWTYVVIGGKGYHVDATWALHGDYPEERLNLDYFMMTEDDRISQGLEKERFQADMVWIWKTDYDLDRFTATDDSFSAIHGGAQFVGMDTEKNVIKYITWDGKQRELSYGDT